MRDIELTKAYQRSKLDVTGQLLKDKVILDIYRRLGNIVLYQVREIRKEQDSAVFQAKTRAQQKRIEKNKRKILVNRCFQLNDLVNHEIISAFEEFQEKLKNANWSRLREEGYLD